MRDNDTANRIALHATELAAEGLMQGIITEAETYLATRRKLLEGSFWISDSKLRLSYGQMRGMIVNFGWRAELLPTAKQDEGSSIMFRKLAAEGHTEEAHSPMGAMDKLIGYIVEVWEAESARLASEEART